MDICLIVILAVSLKAFGGLEGRISGRFAGGRLLHVDFSDADFACRMANFPEKIFADFCRDIVCFAVFSAIGKTQFAQTISASRTKFAFGDRHRRGQTRTGNRQIN